MLIGITGKAGAGKDTVADILVGKLDYIHLSFAGPLKEALSVLGIGEPTRALKETNLPGKPYSYRLAAQTLGTEWARSLDTNFWVGLALDRVKEWNSRGRENIVFSDVRFDSEAEMIRANGGKVILVTGRAYEVANPGHASEAGISSVLIDAAVDNTGTLCDLNEQVLDLINSWRE